MANALQNDSIKIGNYTFTSRLFVGTGKYKDFAETKAAIELSGAEVVTVAVRRINLSRKDGEEFLFDYIDPKRFTILPNTAGCFTVEEAVRTAQLAREALDTDLIKLEVIGDTKTLYPDNEGTLAAAKILVDDGFTVLPYCLDDPILARKLEDVGCAAVMPLAAPIGSGLGLRNPFNIMNILEAAKVPVIVDAGVGTASDAARAMELGVGGVLMNTAIAGAKDPLLMATAMKYAVQAGRAAYLAGRIPKKLFATASSPIEGMIE
jgi:thiazole synthase